MKTAWVDELKSSHTKPYVLYVKRNAPTSVLLSPDAKKGGVAGNAIHVQVAGVTFDGKPQTAGVAGVSALATDSTNKSQSFLQSQNFGGLRVSNTFSLQTADST